MAIKHLGISQMMPKVRRKYYFPSIAKNVQTWVQQSGTCIIDKCINSRKKRPGLLNLRELDIRLEDAVHRDFFRNHHQAEVEETPPHQKTVPLDTLFDTQSPAPLQ